MNWIRRLFRRLKPALTGAASGGETKPIGSTSAIHFRASHQNDLDKLAASYKFHYERTTLPDSRVRLTAYFEDGDVVMGLGMDTKEALLSLRNRIRRSR